MPAPELPEEQRAIVNRAVGRLFSLMSRPFQPGDLETYWACRNIILSLCDSLDQNIPWRPNYVRDRLKGAPGDF